MRNMQKQMQERMEDQKSMISAMKVMKDMKKKIDYDADHAREIADQQKAEIDRQRDVILKRLGAEQEAQTAKDEAEGHHDTGMNDLMSGFMKAWNPAGAIAATPTLRVDSHRYD